jgi:seryl-tRNA synthetase
LYQRGKTKFHARFNKLKYQILCQVLELDEELTQVSHLLQAQKFNSAAQIMVKMLEALKKVQQVEPEVSRAVKTQATLSYEQLMLELSNVWKESVVCHHDEEGAVVLRVVQQPLPELLAALNLIGNDHKIKTFANKLLELPMSTVMLSTTEAKLDDPQEVI